MKFDRIDLKILDLLQRDATTAIGRIADQVGLSQTPCWKRIQKHEETGVIQRRVAILDRQLLGLGLTAFVLVEAVEHTAEWREQFLQVVDSLECVCDVYRLAGAYDFLLRVVIKDMPAYDLFYEKLTEGVRLRAVNALFSLEDVRVSTRLPLAALAENEQATR